MLTNLRFLYIQFILSFLLIGPSLCYSLTTDDSLHDQLDIQKIKNNLEFIENNLIAENDSIINLTKKTLQFSKKINYQEGIVACYYYLGKIWQLSNESDSAIYYFQEGLKTPVTNPEYLENYYIELSNLQRITGNYGAALEYALKLKEIVDQQDNPQNSYLVYNLLALCYQTLMEYNLAQKNFELSAKLAMEANKEAYAGVVYSNIGKLLYDQDKLDEALIYFEKGILLGKKHKLNSSLGNSYTIIAQIFMKKDMLDSARHYLFSASDLNRKSNNKIGLTYTLMGVSNYYFLSKDYKNALAHLELTIQYATSYSLKSILSNAYKLKAKIYAEQKNYKKAFENFELFFTTHSEIYNFIEINKVKSLQQQLVEKERESDLFELKLEKQETINQLILIIGSLLLMVGIIILIYLLQIKKLNRELVLSKTKAEESDRLKSQFLKTISHEIRTPLNGIVGFSEMIRSKELDEKELGQINSMINKNTHDLISTIENLVDIAHLTTNQYNVTQSTINVIQLLQNVLNVAKEYPVYSSKSNIKISLETNENIQLYTDKNIISKILLHLVKNAILYTEKGSITLGYNIDKSSVIFYVKDTGIGIPQEKIDAIFSPFTQGDEDISIKVGGTGLGLTIVNGLIKIIDGKIWVGSEINKGSTFYISLPLS
jgi:signal transduction histidine kinase